MGWCQHCAAPHAPPSLASRRCFCAVIDVLGCDSVMEELCPDLPPEAVYIFKN